MIGTNFKTQISLNSMQKYQPRVWIQKLSDESRRNGDASKPAFRDTSLFTRDEHLDTNPFATLSVNPTDLFTNMSSPDIRSGTNSTDLFTNMSSSDGRRGRNDVHHLVDRNESQLFVFEETSFTTVTAYQNQQV